MPDRDEDLPELRISDELKIEVEPEPPGPLTVGDLVEQARSGLSRAGIEARRLVDRGRYRKVRISRNGKPVVPDIPLVAVAVAEAASLYGAGFARVLAAHVGARFLFDIEVVNEADRFFKHGVERFLEGDWERAEESLLKSVKIDDCHAAAYLQLGVLYRLIHKPEQARSVLERACALDETGDVGRKAADILRVLED
jgi:tetratricopeptide (TPR) repeat protein